MKNETHNKKHAVRNIAEYLRDKYGPWGWMGQRAHDANGVNRILPLDIIISCDTGRDVPYFFNEGKVFSLEKEGGVRKSWSNEDLKKSFDGDMGERIIGTLNSYENSFSLLCYRSIGLLEKDIQGLKHAPRIFAVPEKMKEMFDNKILLYNTLDSLGIEKIPGKVSVPDNFSFEGIKEELGLPFVVQFPYGSNGDHTFIVREKKDFEDLKKKCPGEEAVLREFVDGFSFNVNAVIVNTDKGAKVAMSYPSVQITGIKECSNSDSSYCGNDFSAMEDLDPEYLRFLEDQVLKIGQWMAGKGYRGIFGMDFIALDGKVFPVEINPRFQNSTSLYIALRAEEGFADILMLHIAEFLREEDAVLKEFINDFPYEDLMRPVSGAQIVLHNKLSPVVASGDLVPGVYRMEAGGLRFVAEGAAVNMCAQEDFVVTCGVPNKLTLIEPKAPLCKIQAKRSVLAPNKTSLNEEFRKAVRGVYERLALCDEDMLEKVHV